jgi:hypothetical protein
MGHRYLVSRWSGIHSSSPRVIEEKAGDDDKKQTTYIDQEDSTLMTSD